MNCSTDPADLWVVFYEGDRGKIAATRCPSCCGPLIWSPYIHDVPRQVGGKKVRPMGLSIYCQGSCGYMIGHLDGRAPAWALDIQDWDVFNKSLCGFNQPNGSGDQSAESGGLESSKGAPGEQGTST
ncbi:MAG: hypothetical protein ACO1TE_15340 [Prosthecobacter sp.]